MIPFLKHHKWEILALVLVAAAGVLSAAVGWSSDAPKVLEIETEWFILLGAFYVAAQAIERFMDPIAALFDAKQQPHLDQLTHEQTTAEGQMAGAEAAISAAEVAIAALSGAPGVSTAVSAVRTAAAEATETMQENTEQAAAKAAELTKAQSDLKADKRLFIGGLSALIGVAFSCALGLRMIEAIATTPVARGWSRSADIFVTGLAIAGGTKPLHDLISRIEKK